MHEDRHNSEYNNLLRNVGGLADALRFRNRNGHEDESSGSGRRRNPKDATESLDFEEMESIMWRKHHLRRFFQDRGHWWTASRRTTAWRWVLVVFTGFLVACMGAFVQVLTEQLNNIKFSTAQSYMTGKDHGLAFLVFTSFCLLYAFLAGCLCWFEPAAAGSGIPEIKAYLNGVNLNTVVSLQVLYTKVLGMCLSVAAGLPLGKEGPMIHAGSIIGAAVSQGKTLTLGFDTSWTKFQDLRNDRSKRDFVTFGAAAGIAAAFKAPIGGILFTLEEGASYWSTALTFRAFFCALTTELTFTIIFNGFTITSTSNAGEFAFGSFETFTGYRTYELIIFACMGVCGGLMGAFFNWLNEKMTVFRKARYDTPVKKFADLLGITFGFAVICFVLPLAWEKCTPIPGDTSTSDWTVQEKQLLTHLVQFNCPDGRYNQLASLYFTGADTAMQQLYHFKEINGNTYSTFDIGCLILFFVPYFLMAAITSGTFAPAGLFVPTLLSGAAFGRIVGRALNLAAPGYVSDSGSYALIGAAAILGGMSRSTIAATVILLEACGNNGYLLPLMLTFAAARYTGNAFNESIYDMQIHLKQMPFLEGALRSYGLLNYHPITEVMAHPPVTLHEVNLVKDVHLALTSTSHNGYPVVNKDGHLRGFILRKTLCSLLKLRAFSAPQGGNGGGGVGGYTTHGGGGSREMGLFSTGGGANNLLSGNSSDTDVEIPLAPTSSTSTVLVAAAGGGGQHDSVVMANSEIVLTRARSASGSLSEAMSSTPSDMDNSARGLVSLAPAATMFLETLERHYPNYPTIDEVDLTPTEMNHWLDIRPYMDSAPYSINESSSVKRCYRLFRTMGLRHLTVVDGDHRVTGIVTRKDITESRLHEYWSKEGESMQKVMNLDTNLAPAVLSDYAGTGGAAGGSSSSTGGGGGATAGVDGYMDSSDYHHSGGGGGSGSFLQRYLLPNQGIAGVVTSTHGQSQTSSSSTSSSPNLSVPLLDRIGGGGGGGSSSSSWTAANPVTATAVSSIQSLSISSDLATAGGGRRGSNSGSKSAAGIQLHKHGAGDGDGASSHSASAHSSFAGFSDHPSSSFSSGGHPVSSFGGSSSNHGAGAHITSSSGAALSPPSAAAAGKGAVRGKGKEPKSFKASI